MSIKDKYHVESIKSKQTHDWLLHKHYAGRIPNIVYSFGLFNELKVLNGVCTFGIPAVSQWQDQFIELNRLCINDNLEKNVLSFFVSQCLKKTPNKRTIVSFADPNQNHHGYIYQSTNWLYTGIGSDTNKYFLNGIDYHPRHMNKTEQYFINLINGNGGVFDENKSIKELWGSIGGIMERQKGKHRYFFPKTRLQKKELLNKYTICKYPKGDNERYDASYEPQVQLKMF